MVILNEYLSLNIVKNYLAYLILFALEGALLLSFSCAPPEPEAAVLTRLIFEHDGLEREYLYYAPTDLAEDAPLLVVLHGFTSNAENIMSYTGFNRLADDNDFAVVYPQGTTDSQSRAFWNVGYEFHADIETNDLDFIAKLVSFLQAEYSLSKRNIFAAGMSNGGEMSYLLACRYPELFAAVAPVAGTMMSNRFEECNPSRPIPMLAIVGTADKTTNFLGDEQNADGWGAYKSIPSIIEFWTDNMKYDAIKIDTLPDVVLSDNSLVISSTYTSKDNKSEFLYYKVVNGGHDWPGAWGNEDLDASKEIWRFFARHLKEK
ncbi:MAG: polyhydroxybutyrate depolymerase [Neolewinella sp.]|jgi:polyhydroxybutyrate depolymerase